MSVCEKLSLFETSPSTQEIDLLDRSTKKIKDPETKAIAEHSRRGPLSSGIKDVAMTAQSTDEAPQDTLMVESQNPTTTLVNQTQNSLSYKDKLMGEENPVILSFNTIPSYMDEESDIDDDPEYDAPIVLLSKAKKRRIREPWMNAIIIKAFHPKPLGYNYVFPRVQAQWKPNGKWDFIDLGFDFFLVRFQDNEDLSKVIMGGPWFIGPYCLTMRRWELNFDPEEAIRTTTTTAVWARLLNLSADYYDLTTLQKIGNKIGPLLRVDDHTALHTRGQYARVCVQIDLAQPVTGYVRIGKKKQRVSYEGVNALCFHCGRMGHRNNQCPQLNTTSESPKEAANIVSQSTQAPSSTTLVAKAMTSSTTLNPILQTPTADQSFVEDNYGPWLLVEHRKTKRKPFLKASTLEKMSVNPKSRETHDWAVPTRSTGSKTQRATNSSLSNHLNGNVSNALNVAQPLKQGQKIYKAKAPIEDSSKLEPKTQQWVSKAPSKAQGPSEVITIQEPKTSLKIASNPNPGPDIQRPFSPCLDHIAGSSELGQPTLTTPILCTSTSTTGIDSQILFPQNSTSPLFNHGFVPNPAPRLENPNVSSKRPDDCSNGDNCGVDTGLLITQGVQMVSGSTVHGVASPHSHKHRGDVTMLDEEWSLIKPLLLTNYAYKHHLKVVQLQGKMECIHLILKALLSIETHTERDFQLLFLPYHFPLARYLSWTFQSLLPVFNPLRAQIALGLSNNLDWIMKIISWNCRGALKAGFRKGAMDLKRIHNPAMLLILETKIYGQNAQEVADSLGFPNSCVVNSDGLTGGLWLLWDDSRLTVDILSTSNQATHAVIQVSNNPLFPFNWFFSCIYDRPHFEIRNILWQELTTMANVIQGPWMIIGDFNDVVDQSEKFGGNDISQTRVRAYLDCMNNCNMVDLGLIGNRFTWVNMHFSNQLIKERLDRAWANLDWKLNFPEASLFHLPRTHSDHCPILLDLNPLCPRPGCRPPKLEKFWIEHPDFQDINHKVWVDNNLNTTKCLELTMNQAKAWSQATFGNIFKKKKKVLSRIKVGRLISGS
ncbi:hypothetical protein SLEP1_g10449 [Rubroshorea leprosula]|uniref:CCHC-type domain-containing protein n=1 Tax=Rubroshorea leprosula TaxID=152421 RepID=A0AAV5I846_9ROSI|nr:hypothetical protein SLEP1_g10449 [Rubroshorea leprosula]